MPTQNSLRRDIEVGMSAILLLTQLFSLLLVFLWRHVAAFSGRAVWSGTLMAEVRWLLWHRWQVLYCHYCSHANCMKGNGSIDQQCD